MLLCCDYGDQHKGSVVSGPLCIPELADKNGVTFFVKK